MLRKFLGKGNEVKEFEGLTSGQPRAFLGEPLVVKVLQEQFCVLLAPEFHVVQVVISPNHMRKLVILKLNVPDVVHAPIIHKRFPKARKK